MVYRNKLNNIAFTEIEFTGKFDCIICLNADMPPVSLFEQLEGIEVIAADGAANKLADIGIIPDYIIGDLDSYNQGDTRLTGKSIVIGNPDQEINDFEKILRFAIESKYQQLLVTGFHGGELEHTMNNWSVFMRFARKMNLCIFDNGRYGLPAATSLKFRTAPDEIVSLIPQPEAIITTHNLKWRLTREELKLGSREGARNRATGNDVLIEIHSGELLIFIESRIPGAPKIHAFNI